MKKRWVVCLGAGESQVSLIKNIRSIGYSVLAIDRNPESSGFKYANEIIVESTYHADSIIEKLKKITKLKKIEWIGLVARCTGRALFTAAGISETFKLSGISKELASVSTSKSALREFSLKNNIRMPYGNKFSSYKDFNIKYFGEKIIIKPDFTIVGKKSVNKIDSNNRVQVHESINLALLDSGNNLVEVEEFVEGYDCTYLAWFEHGKSTTVLTWDELISFDEKGCLYSIGVSMPSISISMNQSSRLNKVINKFAILFPDVRALIAFSFRVDKDGEPWLIEVHADITGDSILDKLAPTATGCDFLLELTKLIIDGDINNNFRIRFLDSVKSTALIYKNDDFNQHNDTILTAEDIHILHKNINSFLGGVLLEQEKVLCDLV